MQRRRRRNHTSAFRAKVVLAGIKGMGRSGLEACSTAHQLNKQTYPSSYLREYPGTSDGAVLRCPSQVSSISVTNITLGIDSSTTSITAVSIADDTSFVCVDLSFVCVDLRLSGWSRASVVSSRLTCLQFLANHTPDMMEAKGFRRLKACKHLPVLRAGSSLTRPNISSQMKLKRMPMPHSMFHGNACFAFKKIWDIALQCTRY